MELERSSTSLLSDSWQFLIFLYQGDLRRKCQQEGFKDRRTHKVINISIIHWEGSTISFVSLNVHLHLTSTLLWLYSRMGIMTVAGVIVSCCKDRSISLASKGLVAYWWILLLISHVQVIENFSWNIKILCGQADLLKTTQHRCEESLKQVSLLFRKIPAIDHYLTTHLCIKGENWKVEYRLTHVLVLLHFSNKDHFHIKCSYC